MRIAIDTIPDDGVRVGVQGSEPWAVEAATLVLEVPAEQVGGSLLVERRGRSMRVRGSVSARGTRTCERCGETTTLLLDNEVDLAYVPVQDSPSGGSEIRLSSGDLDVGWYRDGVLDLSDVFAEALALHLPPRITCTDTAACDARVEALLDTGDAPSDSPFAVLGKLV